MQKTTCTQSPDTSWRCVCRCGAVYVSLVDSVFCSCAITQNGAQEAVTLKGPGTELHALLGRFGLTASPDCKCTSRAALMDANGCDWCEANIEEIVGWLRESAAERGLPFVDAAGRMLVRRAIANARRKEAARVAQEKADRPHVHPEP